MNTRTASNASTARRCLRAEQESDTGWKTSASTHCHLVRYDRIDQALLDKIGATAIFISGNSFAPADYSPQALEPIHAIIRETESADLRILRRFPAHCSSARR